ncbi:unnamed protein product [Oreochromis niloticus]|nr:unnamed protein product [Mustela putorius furo]
MISLLMFCYFSGASLGIEVRQSSSDIIAKASDKVQIFCSHDKTDYRMMFWYKQSPGDTAMKLIGFLNFAAVTVEEQYRDHFNITVNLGGDSAKNGSLTIQVKGQEHSAVYYCAASKAQ